MTSATSSGRAPVCPLGIATGDPAGVGPAVALMAIARLAAHDTVVLFGDAQRLRAGARACAVDERRLRDVPATGPWSLHVGEIGLADTGQVSDAAVHAHAPSLEAGHAQMKALAFAVDAALAGYVRGLVTAPVSKEAIASTGVPFIGHTEYLAQRAGLADDDVTMMFLGPRLNVGLVTTHLSVREAPATVTRARVARSIRHLADALSVLHPDRSRRLVVTGLNPHAGEGGMFGDEEQTTIAPTVDALRAELHSAGTLLTGPRPAEAAFREAAAGAWDGVVAMIHDQATIASKLLDWGNAVNVTWGLPFVRTSVDHGVAYDAAARGSVEADGMCAAFALAQRLTR